MIDLSKQPDGMFAFRRSRVDPLSPEVEEVPTGVPSTRYCVYGHTWESRDHANWWKAKIEAIPYQIKRVLGRDTEVVQSLWQEALCVDEGVKSNPLTPTVTRVQRLTDLRAELDRLISVHGENVAFRHKHIGMGHYLEEVVTLEPSPLKR